MTYYDIRKDSGIGCLVIILLIVLILKTCSTMG